VCFDERYKTCFDFACRYSQVEPVTFSSLFGPKVPISLVECIQDLLRYEPTARLTTLDCINHLYYQEIAPRLQPPQARAVVAATTSEEQAALGKSNAKATAMNSIGSVMDQRAQRSALPPSHSMMPQASKPAFGISTSNADHDTDVPMEARESQEADKMRWTPQAGGSNTSQYPAAVGSKSAIHASTTQYDNNLALPSHIETSRSEAQYYADAQRRARDDEMDMQQGQSGHAGRPNQQQQPAGYPTLVYDHANPVYRQTRADNQSFLAEPSDNREADGASLHPEMLSAKEREKRKSKGWISSVLGGGNSSASQTNLQANIPRRQSDHGQQQQAIASNNLSPSATGVV
jgi:meiosis induction protein kinase IME2/SME1